VIELRGPARAAMVGLRAAKENPLYHRGKARSILRDRTNGGQPMNRRGLLISLIGAGIAWPLPVGAQQKPMPMVGFLSSGSAEGFASLLPPFREGLKEAGFCDGPHVSPQIS